MCHPDEPCSQSASASSSSDAISGSNVIHKSACSVREEVSSSIHTTRISARSGGSLLNENVYIDVHLSSALKMSASTSLNKETDIQQGPRDQYREALVEADIDHLRSACVARGIDHHGHSRNILIDKLLNGFSFLK